MPGFRHVAIQVCNHDSQEAVPQSWRDRVKRFWQITERPALSESAVQRLEEIFEQDLAKLGRVLGIELSCRRYREVASITMPVWKSSLELLAH